jgi:hypothetical protein
MLGLHGSIGAAFRIGARVPLPQKEGPPEPLTRGSRIDLHFVTICPGVFGTIGTWSAYSADKAFDLKGLYLGSAWAAAEPVTISGYKGGVLKYSCSVTATNVADDLPELFALNFKGVGEMRFTGYSSHIVVDNIQIKVSAVPQPKTYAMMLAGLGAVGFVVRRRRQG